MFDKMIRRLLARLLCWDNLPFIFIHGRIRVVQEFHRARKLRCDRCGRYFGMSDEHQAVLPWDDEMEHLYADVLQHGRTIK